MLAVNSRNQSTQPHYVIQSGCHLPGQLNFLIKSHFNRLHSLHVWFVFPSPPRFSSFQLFRRVAAALPGMESLDDANPEGSILYSHSDSLHAPRAELLRNGRFIFNLLVAAGTNANRQSGLPSAAASVIKAFMSKREGMHRVRVL